MSVKAGLFTTLKAASSGADSIADAGLAAGATNRGVWVSKAVLGDMIRLASGQADFGIANNHMCRDQMLANEACKPRRPTPAATPGNGTGPRRSIIKSSPQDSAFRPPGALPVPNRRLRPFMFILQNCDHDHGGRSRAGRSFVSNGPLLRCRANGKLPGTVFTARKGKEINLEISAALATRDPISTIEIIKNGRIERAVPYEEWKRTGKLGRLKFNESGWFLVRTIADNPKTFRFASTAPFYVEIGEAKRRVNRTSAQFFLDWVRERKR